MKQQLKLGDLEVLNTSMTDGVPTDDWHKGLQRLQQDQSLGVIVASCTGHGAEYIHLKQITEVVELATTRFQHNQGIFKWVSASISTE